MGLCDGGIRVLQKHSSLIGAKKQNKNGYVITMKCFDNYTSYSSKCTTYHAMLAEEVTNIYTYSCWLDMAGAIS